MRACARVSGDADAVLRRVAVEARACRAVTPEGVRLVVSEVMRGPFGAWGVVCMYV
jgi:hypothetical protein